MGSDESRRISDRPTFRRPGLTEVLQKESVLRARKSPEPVRIAVQGRVSELLWLRRLQLNRFLVVRTDGRRFEATATTDISVNIRTATVCRKRRGRLKTGRRNRCWRGRCRADHATTSSTGGATATDRSFRETEPCGIAHGLTRVRVTCIAGRTIEPVTQWTVGATRRQGQCKSRGQNQKTVLHVNFLESRWLPAQLPVCETGETFSPIKRSPHPALCKRNMLHWGNIFQHQVVKSQSSGKR